ncbi:MAG: glycosyltransferase family 4 protein, partial [Acidobacteriota bacterium]|nr:glycosyltransferase family 4 protein [Acidobacteriota bacterium]
MRSPSALILTMCYWPEPTGIAPMATDLAEWLAGLGWKVTVVTGFPLMPDWEIYGGYRGKLYQRQTRNKTEIFRSWVYCPARSKKGVMKTWKRVLFDTTLVFTASLTLLSRKSPDVIVAIGPPLQTGLASLLLKKLWRCPVLYWMQDIVPDAAVNVGMMRDGIALKVARRIESAVYLGADRIGIISDGFRQNVLSKNVPVHKQAFLPNWANVSLFDKTPHEDALRASNRIAADDFVVMHAGSMGAK